MKAEVLYVEPAPTCCCLWTDGAMSSEDSEGEKHLLSGWGGIWRVP